MIDSVHSGLSYHFNNLTICIFDEEKFVNSNELTAVQPIDDITVHMESPEIYINRSTSCIACNKVQPVNNEEEFVTCKNCKMTTLASIFQTKLVSQMMIKADQTKLENFTCLNGFLAFSEIMFNEWWVWSLRHWSMVYTTVIVQNFYLYS